MGRNGPSSAEFEIGRFICASTQLPVPLRARQPLAFLHWPALVKACPERGQQHMFELQDLQHPPIYSYD
jgi:hypothetical protein